MKTIKFVDEHFNLLMEVQYTSWHNLNDEGWTTHISSTHSHTDYGFVPKEGVAPKPARPKIVQEGFIKYMVYTNIEGIEKQQRIYGIKLSPDICHYGLVYEPCEGSELIWLAPEGKNVRFTQWVFKGDRF